MMKLVMGLQGTDKPLPGFELEFSHISGSA
jgi:hypothetical protein